MSVRVIPFAVGSRPRLQGLRARPAFDFWGESEPLITVPIALTDENGVVFTDADGVVLTYGTARVRPIAEPE